MAKVYTRKGDTGDCQLIGGQRVPKNDPRVECYGTYDEVCSTIGLLRVEMETDHPKQGQLQEIQEALMGLMSVLATPVEEQEKRTTFNPEKLTGRVEEWIDEMDELFSEKLHFFILPGGCRSSALCQVIRTQIRKAERRMISLYTPPSFLPFANRLSDYFFVLARFELKRNGIDEQKWQWLPKKVWSYSE